MKNLLLNLIIYALLWNFVQSVRIVKRVKVRKRIPEPVVNRRVLAANATKHYTRNNTARPATLKNYWCIGKVNADVTPVCTLRVHDCESHLGEKDVTGNTEEIQCLRKNTFNVQRRQKDCWNEEDKVTVKCSAPFPLDVDFSGQVRSREFTPTFSKSLSSTHGGIVISSYHVKFSVHKDSLWSGIYSVFSVQDKAKEASIYLLMNGETQLPNLQGEQWGVRNANKIRRFTKTSESNKPMPTLEFMNETRMIQFCFPTKGYAIDIRAESATHARHISRCTFEDKSCWTFDKNTSTRLSTLQKEKVNDKVGFLTWTSGQGCVDFYNRYDNGLFVQTSRYDTTYTNYFYGLDKNIYKDPMSAPPEALISVKIPNNEEELEEDSQSSFSCEINDYALVLPIIWYTRYKNGTYKEEKISTEEKCPCYELLKISKEIDQVVCAASRWNSNEWVTSAVNIKVKSKP